MLQTRLLELQHIIEAGLWIFGLNGLMIVSWSNKCPWIQIYLNLCLYWRGYLFKIEWTLHVGGAMSLIFLYSVKKWVFHTYIFFKIACATTGEAQRWMEAFDHAKQQVCENYNVAI